MKSSTNNKRIVYFLIIALVLRLCIMPVTYGYDFIVWTLVAQSTLDGKNMYMEEPNGIPNAKPMLFFNSPFIYRNGTTIHIEAPGEVQDTDQVEHTTFRYVYLPFFMYLLLPLKIFSNITGLPFTFIGKIPMLISDLLIGYFIYGYLRDKGYPEKRSLAGMCLFLFNPLVIYNSAFYGRFDSVCLVFLFLALRNIRNTKFGIYYAASIATKTFPAFILPYFIYKIKKNRLRNFLCIIFLLILVSVPYMTSVESLMQLLYTSIFCNIGKTHSSWFSWQKFLVEFMAVDIVWAIGFLLIIIYLGIMWYLRKLPISTYEYCGLAFLLFIIFSKVVFEQYLIWSIPFLAIMVAKNKDMMALYLLMLLTFEGMFFNPFIYLLNEEFFWIFLMDVSIIVFYYKRYHRLMDHKLALKSLKKSLKSGLSL